MKNARFLSAMPALMLLLPALVFGAAGSITAQQQHVADNFIKALMKSDYKAAYQLFSPGVRSKVPFKIFSDIQKNIEKKIGIPVSYTLKKEADPAAASVYNMVYAKGKQRTAIPLELTFDPADPNEGLASCNYRRNQIRPAGK